MKMLAHPPYAGALIGIILGVIQYFIAVAMIGRIVTREIASAEEEREPLPGLALLPATLGRIKTFLMVSAVTVYPAVGYAVGAMWSRADTAALDLCYCRS